MIQVNLSNLRLMSRDKDNLIESKPKQIRKSNSQSIKCSKIKLKKNQ